MSLSQDEVNALLSGDDSDESEAVEIMSPEDIEAMLDSSAMADESDDDFDTTAAQTLSEEEVAAMLEVSGDGEVEEESDDLDLDELFDRLEEDAPLSYGVDRDGTQYAAKEGLLNHVEIDILGEVGNISMGAVATTMYSLLDRRVSITTPQVSVFDAKEVLTVYKIPFVVATIEYVEGITGNNLLVLKVEDAALITDLLMGGTGEIDGVVELNEMHLSAMSEIMNQMMGASSTSLSKLLGKPVNISPPKSSQVDVGFDVTTVLGDIEMVTKISFDMEIEGLLKSELIQLMPYDVSRDFAKLFMDVGINIPSSEGAANAAASASNASATAGAPEVSAPQQVQMPEAFAAPAPAAVPAGQAEQMPAAAYAPPPEQQQPYPGQAPYPAAPYAPSAYPAQGRLVDVHPVQFQSFDSGGMASAVSGMELVYNIPLQVTVELGKTRKEISEILEFGTGTIVVLDKIAGDPVEIVVNGKLIARGEVVVIDENYGVRITDIING
ncbi:MAG: flagellar motor switch phosphatase FliY [Oscillospiraceae bacterium]|nr:flagellar motor switch phosphatase FliY [Oscillospiraceae bacterium]